MAVCLMDRVTASSKGCTIQILSVVVILSILTVKNNGAGVSRGAVSICGQEIGFGATNSFY